ncbi:CHAT domain-containing protein [Tunturibacter empetritectus]|uniref:CHAT domain-containing protein/Tfp pilus assembly protein PilF n=1 Tax=Tunturiibacter empetritectus TaxID=3069691 RepID=A0A7W8MSC0_9BACT|nr:CHAT domain-containing protein [Edaphobacter lichenicola]MBB5318177.1 CHAT domain-containing protein/Tfp pilus assembly protein PilF [Edaphobacter lichenicola]
MATGIRKLKTSLVLSLLLDTGCSRAPSPFVLSTAYRAAEGSLQRGDLRESLSETSDALAKIDKRDANSIWRFRLLEAEILMWQGRSQDSLTVLKAVDPGEPSDSELQARRSTLQGTAESNLQMLPQAAETFARTESMPGARLPGVRVDLDLGEGKLAVFRHDPVGSERLFHNALNLALDSGLTFGASKALGNLGMLKMSQNRYVDAADYFSESLAAAKKLNAQSLIVRTTGNLGWAYLQMGDLERASELFDESASESHRLGLPADEKTALMSIAAIHFMRHDFITAETSYQRALELAEQLGNRQEEAFALIDLAQIEIERKNYGAAEGYNKRSLEIESAMGDHDTELYSLVNEAQIASLRQDYETAERCLMRVVHDRKASPILEAQALSTFATLDTQQNHFRAAEMHFEEAIASLETQRGLLSREEFKLSFPTNEKAIYDDYIDFLIERKLTDKAFRVTEMHKARTLTEEFYSRNRPGSRGISLAQARKVAGRSGHTILSYWLGPERSYLWMFQAKESHLYILPGEDRIRPLVDAYRNHLTGALSSLDRGDEEGKELYQILIAPVESLIAPQSRVVIVPDEELCGVNFETLITTSKVPHYWIEDVSVTTASSAALLAYGGHQEREASRQKQRKLLLIGDPLPLAYYPPLPHAEEEIMLIKSHFVPEQETIVSGGKATPEAYFRAKPEQYDLIHFVAHGKADRVTPLNSAILLSGQASSPNLLARDIASTRLYAKLVTISACDSAGKRIYSSEGLVGLSWAFLRAGAQNVVASLWEVNDASTPKLMDVFYAAIARGEEPELALRSAKLSLLHSQSAYSRPFFWAPFVLYEGAGSSYEYPSTQKMTHNQ